MANKKKLTKRRKAEMELKAKKEKQRKLIKLCIYIGVALLVVGGIVGIIIASNYEAPEPEYFAEVQIKDKGTVTIKLNSDTAPKAVNKFIELVNKGTYNGKSFYSLENGQLFGGAKDASLAHIFGEFDNGLNHKKGVISMVKSGNGTVNPATFFITTEDNVSLDKTCVAFGEITNGFDIIEGLTVSEDNQPIIEKITIIEK